MVWISDNGVGEGRKMDAEVDDDGLLDKIALGFNRNYD